MCTPPTPRVLLFKSAVIVSCIPFLQVNWDLLLTLSSFRVCSAFHYSTSAFIPWIEHLFFLIIRVCSDASFGYPGGPLLFRNLNFGIDLDSRIASKDVTPSELLAFLCGKILIFI